MIIIRSPLRLSFGGGGTDLPSYYKKNEGFLIAAAINKYVYISIHNTFSKGYYLKYSKYENVSKVSKIRHPLIRAAIKISGLKDDNIEISSQADIPTGTGLGSSGSFCTCLLKGLYLLQGKNIATEELAKIASKIEIEILKEPVGKQDQYVSAYGGIKSYTFQRNGSVINKSLMISKNTIHDLEDNLLLFFTGYTRHSNKILSTQNIKSLRKDKNMQDNLDFVKDLGYKIKKCLEKGNNKRFGELMLEHWEYKKSRSDKITNRKIDKWYNIALNNGAVGGKLVGAGGGGFLMFYASDRDKLQKVMNKENLQNVRFRFDFEGTKANLN